MNLTESDLKQLEARGITVDELESQVNRFVTGFPYLKIYDSARPGAGITVLSSTDEQAAVERWKEFLAQGGTVCKFVPASGAASRMFKSLFAFVDGDSNQPAAGSDVAELLKNIHKTAFFDELNAAVVKLHGKDVDVLLAEGKAKDVVAAIIRPEGLNYGNLPKGLLSFHRAVDGVRTPVEEQLMEGAQSACQADNTVNMHLTVSGTHREAFNKKLEEVKPRIEKGMNVRIKVEMSEQKASTDTVAVNEDNTLFRENGQLVFRPGGHGALIQNLNEITSDVIFIKNIDNVVPDKLRGATLQHKKVIAGYLIELHDKVAAYIAAIDNGRYDDAALNEMCDFLRTAFSFDAPELSNLTGEALASYIRAAFNRPMRVCGMVKNEGEPGGGPYIAYNVDGSRSLQVLESSQIDLSKDENKLMMSKATHFNPVDLVCYVKSVDGSKFNLPDFVDHQTGFISSKSLHGRNLKALELPGLWNGAMSNWLTAFVEVPIETFNPVKTVNDLLRPQHQGE